LKVATHKLLQRIEGCCSVECDLFAVWSIHGERESGRSNKDDWCGVERAADADVCSQGLWLFSLLLIFAYLHNDPLLLTTWFHAYDGVDWARFNIPLDTF